MINLVLVRMIIQTYSNYPNNCYQIVDFLLHKAYAEAPSMIQIREPLVRYNLCELIIIISQCTLQICNALWEVLSF